MNQTKKSVICSVIAVVGLLLAILTLVTGNFGQYQEASSSPLTPECVYCLILFCVVFFCFASQVTPLGVTAMLGALAMAAAGLISYTDVLSKFASQTVMLVVGMMIVGGAFREVGLAHDLGQWIIRHFANRPKLFLVMLILGTCLVSAFMSNTAAVVIFMAVASAASEIQGSRIRRKDTYMAIGLASVVGGNLTLFASTPQVSIAGILNDMIASGGKEIVDGGVRSLTNWDMLMTGLPLVVLLVGFYLLFGDRLQKKYFDFEEIPEAVPAEQAKVCPTYKKVLTLGAFLISIILFIIGEMEFPLANGGVFTLGIKSGTAAIIGACICVVFRCIPEKKALHCVDWTSIVMLAGVLGFSAGMQASGATALISRLFPNPILSYLILIVVAVVMTNMMSNTAVAVMLCPIGIGIALQTGTNPMGFVMGILLASNLSFATPMATVPVTMTRSVGYRFWDYFRIGGAFTLIGLVYVLVAIPLMYQMF